MATVALVQLAESVGTAGARPPHLAPVCLCCLQGGCLEVALAELVGKRRALVVTDKVLAALDFVGQRPLLRPHH